MANYLIAAGGTGMRCLESFIHLCAIGMFDSKEFHILLVDTDHENGNMARTERLLKNYQLIKGDTDPKQNAFFSAKLKVYKFVCNYEDIRTFSALTRQDAILQDGNRANRVELENEILLNLLVDTKTQNFDLAHGYRSQTHIGSALIYHDIVYGRNGVDRHELDRFLAAMQADGNNPVGAKRVFVFGSLFGGTGASAIPILPKALEKAANNLGADGGVNFTGFEYGATLLTNYFTFMPPSQNQLNTDLVVANSTEFSLNSKAALMYYQNDNTVKTKYKRLYMIGWPARAKDFSGNSKDVITGGANQKNEVHTTELMSAFAAHDFFHSANLGATCQWRYRAAVQNAANQFEYTAPTFTEQHTEFKQKVYAMLAFCAMLKTEYFREGGEVKRLIELILRERAMQGKVHGLENLVNDTNVLTAINEYVSAFFYENVNGEVHKGWLQQLYLNSESASFLSIHLDAFSTNMRTLEKLAWGKLHNDANDRERIFGKGKILGFGGSPFDDFKKQFQLQNTLNIGTPAENLFAIMYLIFNQLHKY